MRIPLFSPLRTRLVVLPLLVVVPAIFLVMWYLTSQASSLLRQNSERELAMTAKNLADSIEDWDQYMDLALTNLTRQPAIVGMKTVEQRPILHTLHQVYDRITYANVVALNGHNTARIDERAPMYYGDREWFRQAVAGVPLSRQAVISRTSNHPALLYAAPIRRSDNQVVGVVMVGFDLARINEMIEQLALHEGSYALVINESGQCLGYSSTLPNYFLEKLTTLQPAQLALNGRLGQTQFTDEQGQNSLAYAVRLKNGWTVITVRSESSILAQANHLHDMGLAISLTAIILVGLGLWLLANRFIRPINELTTAAENLADGQWECRVATTRRDELGILATAFNYMAEHIQTSYHTIEKQVDQRTQELSQRNRELQQARLTAENANNAKDEFLANMSHEIRTPITAIVGYIDLLLDPKVSAANHKVDLHTIQRNAQHLLELINDILDLSRITAGHMPIYKTSCNLPQLLQEVSAIFRSGMRDKKLHFDLACATPLPKTIQTDPLRLRQILLNLLANALKFTFQGSVKLQISHFLHPAGNVLQFDICDTGIGIAPEVISKLFKPFSQADESTTRRFGGSGLGLNISQQLAELLGGTISVTSQPNVGSTFSLRLEVGELPEPTMVTTLKDPPPVPQPQPRQELMLQGKILLAEDGPDNQRLISRCLELAGAKVEIAANGRIAVDMVTKNTFDLVLMDLQMPEMDGYTATTLIRSLGLKLPIIALTAHAMPEVRQKCLQAGCDDYLTKPIDRQHLLTVLQRHLPTNLTTETPTTKQQESFPFPVSGFQLEEQSPATLAASPLRPNAPSPSFTIESLVSPLSLDPEMQPLLQQFLRDLPTRVQGMYEFLEQNNLEELRRRLHQLKGASGSYGFPQLSTLMAQAENTLKTQSDMDLLKTQIDEISHLIGQVVQSNQAKTEPLTSSTP